MGITYPNEIKRILHFPGGPVGRATRRIALDIAKEAKHQAELTFGHHPMDKPRTGRLAKSYRVEVLPMSNTFIVRNDRKYAAAMEKGAKPHRIAARRTTLQFYDRQGRFRSVTFVRHPGSVGRRTLLTATQIVMKRRFGRG